MPWSRSRPSSDDRGYGPAHRKARLAYLAAYQPGDPCCLCGHPMHGPTSGLELDHLPGTQTYRGLAHGMTRCSTCGLRCNRTDGARRGRARQTSSHLRW
jgi:hypothetical protein